MRESESGQPLPLEANTPDDTAKSAPSCESRIAKRIVALYRGKTLMRVNRPRQPRKRGGTQPPGGDIDLDQNARWRRLENDDR
jgi:hypothetical protein